MSMVVLAPFVLLSGELKDIFSTVWFWDEVGFWVQMILTTFTGLIVQISMLVFLVYTSPLSFTVASVSKVSLISYFSLGLKLTVFDLTTDVDPNVNCSSCIWKPFELTGKYKYWDFFFYLIHFVLFLEFCGNSYFTIWIVLLRLFNFERSKKI